MSNLEQIQKSIPIEKTCRKIHIEKNSFRRNVKFCSFCDSLVKILSDNTCLCCRNKVKPVRNSKYSKTKKIMNKILTRYDSFLPYYEKNLLKQNIPVFGQVEHQLLIYQVDLKFAVLFLNAQEKNEEERHLIYGQIKNAISEVKFNISWGRSHAFKLIID